MLKEDSKLRLDLQICLINIFDKAEDIQVTSLDQVLNNSK